MNNSKLFLDIDLILKESLTIRTIQEKCSNFKQEIDNIEHDLILEKGKNIVKNFLEKIGYIFLNQDVDHINTLTFLKSGKEYSFYINTLLEQDSENIHIEYECDGVKTGIAQTNANFLIHYYPLTDEVWLIKTDKLKNLIRENKDVISKITNESNKKKYFILEKNKFQENFRIADINQ